MHAPPPELHEQALLAAPQLQPPLEAPQLSLPATSCFAPAAAHITIAASASIIRIHFIDTSLSVCLLRGSRISAPSAHLIPPPVLTNSFSWP